MSKNHKKIFKDQDFYFIGSKEPLLFHREELNDFSKEKLIELFIHFSKKAKKYAWRIGFLERLIDNLGFQGKSKQKVNKDLFLKMEYVRLYKELYRIFKNHPKTALNLEKDKDFKLLKRFGSSSKRWIGDDVAKKEKEGEILSYTGHTKRYYRFRNELIKAKYSNPPMNKAELKQWKVDQKFLDSHPDPLDG